MFILRSHLTCIKSIQDAKNVLEATSENNQLHVEVSEGEYRRFYKVKSGDVAIEDLNKDSTPFNIISIQYPLEEAAKDLFKIRKQFNAKFRD